MIEQRRYENHEESKCGHLFEALSKDVSKLLPVHEAQILTYLKITDLKTGFLINFHEPYFKNAIRHFVL